MSVFTDLFVSKKKLAQRALQQKLVAARTPTGGYDIDTIMGVYHDAYDDTALDAVLAKKPKSEKNYRNRAANEKLAKMQGSAQYLKDMKEAEIGLQNGNIAPAVKLAVKGNYNAFKEVTKDTSNVHALAAKASLWTEKEFHNPSGDHGDPSFNRTKAFAASQARMAVEGYGSLNMAAECEQAMRSYSDNTHFEEDEYFSEWKKEFHEGKPGNEAKNKAVYTIALSQRNGASFEDHMAAAQFLKDDAVRNKAMQAMSGMMNAVIQMERGPVTRNTLKPEQEDQLFGFLAEHIKTRDGSFQQSQATAMNVLMKDHKDRFKSNGFDPISEEGENLIATVQDELRMGSPHVVQEAFIKGDMLEILELNEQVARKDNNYRLLITDILPSDLEGVQVNQARNAIGQKVLTDMAVKIQRGVYDVNKEARNVALLSRDVMNGGGKHDSKEVLQAAGNLRKVIVTETEAARIDHDLIHSQIAEANLSTYQVEDHLQANQKGFEKRHPGGGYGRAMLDALKYDQSPRMVEIVSGIEKNMPENIVPQFQKLKTVPAL